MREDVYKRHIENFIKTAKQETLNRHWTDIEKTLNIKIKKNAREVDFSGVFKIFSVSGLVTFSFTSSLGVELHSLLKLFITLFITSKVIFKSNSKDDFINLLIIYMPRKVFHKRCKFLVMSFIYLSHRLLKTALVTILFPYHQFYFL